MSFYRMPSKKLIDALGWDAVVEIDSYLDQAAEELRAERRRLEAARRDVTSPGAGLSEVLFRLAELEYELRAEISGARQRLRREIEDVKDELRLLRSELHPKHASIDRAT